MHTNKISSGKNPPSEIKVIIGIPPGSSVRYEPDKESGVISVDLFLHTSMSYPFNYGSIPRTHAEDGDPVDVVLVSRLPIASGNVGAARLIGLLEMEDEAGADNKIIAAPPEKIDPAFGHFKDVDDSMSI
jgi:inorganic pyrophosphatase